MLAWIEGNVDLLIALFGAGGAGALVIARLLGGKGKGEVAQRAACGGRHRDGARRRGRGRPRRQGRHPRERERSGAERDDRWPAGATRAFARGERAAAQSLS